MKARLVVALVVLMVFVPPCLAQTPEAAAKLNYQQEFDITFWQTMPFAFFWGSWLDREVARQQGLTGGEARMEYVLGFSVVTSLLNAYWHTNKVMSRQ